MTKDDAHIAEMLLRLKSKAANGLAWSAEDLVNVELCFDKPGDISALAAWCVLASERHELHNRAVGVFRTAVEHLDPNPYVELLLYEAAACIEAHELNLFGDAILRFVERSVTRRTINLANTIFLLGRLARMGDERALGLLYNLSQDKDSEVQNYVAIVLKGLKRDLPGREC
jgi:hypothetical protein